MRYEMQLIATLPCRHAREKTEHFPINASDHTNLA
jgi:hypothetical protein